MGGETIPPAELQCHPSVLGGTRALYMLAQPPSTELQSQARVDRHPVAFCICSS